MEARKRKKEFFRKNIDVTMYYEDIKNKFKERYKVERSVKTGDDSILRLEIHRRISAYIIEGKNKEEILSIFSKEEKYTKYFSYIPNWIDDRIKKDGSFDRSFNKFI